MFTELRRQFSRIATSLSKSCRRIATIEDSRIGFEELENRCVPAAFVWAYRGQGTANASVPQNWRVNGDPAVAAPGAQDDIMFTNAANGTCIIDAAFGGTVQNASIDGYAGTITLQRSLMTTIFNQNSGTIAGAFPITVNGTGSWTGGSLTGNGNPTGSTFVLAANSTFDISNNVALVGRVIQNSGQIRWTGNSTIVTSNGGALHNLASGSIIKPTDQNNLATISRILGDGAFFNSGFVKAEIETSLAFDVPVTSYRGTLASDGEISFNSSATFAGGDPSVNQIANLTGDGVITGVGGGSFAITGNLASNVALLDLLGDTQVMAGGGQGTARLTILDGKANFSGSTTIAGQLLVEGNVAMAGTVEFNAPVTIFGPVGQVTVHDFGDLTINGDLSIIDGAFVNESLAIPLTWLSGEILLSGNGFLENKNGDIWITGNGGRAISGTGSLLNDGVLTVEASTMISATFQNSGSTRLLSGTLTIGHDFSQVAGGSISFEQGHLQINGDFFNDGLIKIRRDGQIAVNTFTNNRDLAFQEPSGSHRISTLTVVQRGAVPGGNFIQGQDATLTMNVDGVHGSDRLVVNGTSSLDGTLTTNISQILITPEDPDDEPFWENVPIPANWSWKLIEGQRQGAFADVVQPQGYGFSAPTYSAGAVRVQNPDLQPPPGQAVVVGVNSDFGGANGSQLVHITGSGFRNAGVVQVLFGDMPAPYFHVYSDEHIEVLTPFYESSPTSNASANPGKVDVKIRCGLEVSSAMLIDAYEFVDETVSVVLPDQLSLVGDPVYVRVEGLYEGYDDGLWVMIDGTFVEFPWDGVSSISEMSFTGWAAGYHTIQLGQTQYTQVVRALPTITSDDEATFAVGSASSFTVTSTGFPTATFDLAGPLPAGVGWFDNGDGTMTISGTPESGYGGVYEFTISGDNGTGSVANQTFTLTVEERPYFLTESEAAFAVGQPASFTAIVAGFPGHADISLTGTLPSGVSFVDNGDGTATLSGTAAVGTAGTYSLTLSADNGVGAPATQSFQLNVVAPAKLTSVVIDDGTQQRGVVRSITLNFDAAVDAVAAGAIAITDQNNNAISGLTLDVAGVGTSTLVITFADANANDNSGPVTYASLADGRYRLKIDGGLLTSFGFWVDADADDAAGGTKTVDFHRLFADYTGNAFVDATDIYPYLINSIDKAEGDSGYQRAFDYNNDDYVDATDIYPHVLMRLDSGI